MKEVFELAAILIINFRHSANISHLRVAITRPTNFKSTGRYF